MLRPLDLRGLPLDALPGALPRPAPDGAEPVEAVRALLADVRARGDAALRDATARFDGVDLDRIDVPPAAWSEALGTLPLALRDALRRAHEAIEAHHRLQVESPLDHEHRGVRITTIPLPVDRAGCYVPGGRATYPSTLLMTATIARVAGVGHVAVAVPPGRETGRPPLATLAAAAVAGVDAVYAVGGAQAIGALAYGTETVAPVDVICGPGNVYVALAEREVAGEGRVRVPASFAGPSEVVVVADASVPPEFAAVDVVVQAEHGPGGLAWLVTWDQGVLAAVSEAVARIAAASPRRVDVAATLNRSGYAVLVDGPEAAMAVANAIAPEHLELQVAGARDLVPLVRNAGAVFLGPWSPASLGDYLAGPSHVLPTFGSARFASALTVHDFVKHIHVVEADEAAFADAAPHLVALAEAEGLDAHADSARVRVGA